MDKSFTLWVFLLLFTCISQKGVLCKHANPKKLHHLMNQDELRRYFGVDSHDEVPAYDVTYPYQSTPDGKFLSHDLRSSHRVKRNTERSDEHHYSFKAFDKTLHLNLRENKDLIAPGLVLESYADGKVKRTPLEPRTHYIGTVRDHPGSTVAISNKEDMSGLIQLQDESMILQPLPRRLANKFKRSEQRVPHVIYKTAGPSDNIERLYVNDAIEMSSLKSFLAKREPNLRELEKKEVSSPDKRIAYGMVADEQVKAMHGNNDNATAEYMLLVANILNSIFHDASIGERKISIVVTTLSIVTNTEFGVDSDASAQAKIDQLVKWTNAKYPKPESGTPDTIPFDAISLLHKGGSDIGLALFKSLCVSRYAPTISADFGLQTAFKLAHEVAHNIGVEHDDKYGNAACVNNHVMSTSLAAGPNSFKWSECSKSVIQAFLSGSSSSCLDNAPIANRPRLSMEKKTTLPGVLVDGDKQCKYQFGSEYYRCPQKLSNCESLFCTNNGFECQSYIASPMDGTTCGVRNWCIGGKCVDNGLPMVHGGWSSWSDTYSTCSQTCGGGVQYKKRTCTNPVPKYGGNPCEGSDGKSEQKGYWKYCNPEPCPANSQSFRDIQCKAYNNKAVEYYKGDACSLKCKVDGYFYDYGLVKDGTLCYDNPFVSDVCVEGKCRKVGCDKILDSNAQSDRCGVCKGDGSTCKEIMGTYTDNPDGFDVAKASTISTLAVGTTHAYFKKKKATWNYLGVTYSDGSYLISIPSWSKVVYAAGAKIVYTRENNQDTDSLEITGPPLTQSLLIKFIRYYEENQGVTYSYYEPTSVAQVPSVKTWRTTEWSSCSKTCAGGVKQRSVYCIRSDDNTTIGDSFCDSADKPVHQMACNTEKCPVEWYLSPWSDCTKTCGNGTQSRTLTCRRKTTSSEYETISDSECPVSSKPSVSDFTRRCAEIACNPKWKALAWSACSTTCGSGVMTRNLICVRIEESGNEETVSSDFCDGIPKPLTSQPCNENNLCAAPAWLSIACFKASSPFPLEETLGDFSANIDWDNTTALVGKCAQVTHDKKYKYFAVGNNGICYSGPNTKTKYYSQGAADKNDCTNGVGKNNFIFAYTFEPIPAFQGLGCFADDYPNRALPDNYANMREHIDWYNMNKTIDQCAYVARDKSYSYFAVQFYGECWSANNSVAATDYNKHGASSNCAAGVGGSLANYVYKFESA